MVRAIVDLIETQAVVVSEGQDRLDKASLPFCSSDPSQEEARKITVEFS